MNETSSTQANTRQPTHEEISHKAKELWESYGRPAGRDEEIWLEAERALQSPASTPSLQPTKDTSAPAPRNNVPAISAPPATSAGAAVATPKMPAARGGKRRTA